MVLSDPERRWALAAAQHAGLLRAQASAAVGEPLLRRRDLIPTLPPFERAILHLSDILVQVEQLLQEDLTDLQPALLTCLQQAQTDEAQTAARQALVLFEQLQHQLPLQLYPLLDCFC